MEEIRQEEKDYGPRESQIQMSPPLSFAPEAPVEPKGNARPSPNSPSASPRLEMSMRSPERAFPRGDGSGEEKEPRQPGRCDGCLQVFYSAAEKYDAAWENVLRFCGVALAAYIGSFIRIACTRIRVMQSDSGYTGLLVAQVAGCFIMGFACKHTNYSLKGKTNLFRKVIFVSITSGLCGSITSFSSWNHVCNKSFFLQWDLSWESFAWTYNASRFIDTLLCLWTGVMVPLSALNFGSFLAEFSPICDKEDQGKEYEMANQNVDENGSGGSTGEVGRRHEAGKEGSVPRSAVTGASSSVDQEESHTTSGYVACGCCGSTIDMASRHLELLLLFLFVFITLLIICLSPNESQWIFAALSGAIGAYFRLGLSSMNRMREGFPLGTFAANVLGSWIEASVLVLAKLGVDYNEQLSQQFLFGMAIGFCGCLTTISTFVKELNSLSYKNALVYALLSFFLSQVGYILFLDSPAFAAVVPASTFIGEMNVCSFHEQVCGDMLTRLQCTSETSINMACLKPPPRPTQIGGGNTTGASVAVDATPSGGGNTTTVSLPVALGSDTYVGKCSCGAFNMGSIVRTGIFASEMSPGLKRTVVQAWPRNPSEVSDPGSVVDLCVSHSRVCSAWLDRTNCPWDQRRQNSCSRMMLDNFVGQCSCGDGNSTFGEVITQSIVTLSLSSEVRGVGPDLTACELVQDRCNAALAVVSCPASKRMFTGCGKDGWLVSWTEVHCGCGNSLNLTKSVEESILGGFLSGQLTVVPETTGEPGSSVALCQSFNLTCNTLHRTMMCPETMRSLQACNADSSFVGQCMCGNMALGDWVGRQVATIIGQRSLSRRAGKWPTTPPYTLVISNDPSVPFFERD